MGIKTPHDSEALMNKISIIGSGSVGSTIAYTLTVMGLASEIVMIDVNNEKAVGEALDIRQGTPFCGSCTIYAGDYRDAINSNIVIITAGVARKPGQSRLDLAQTNVDILKDIIPEITKHAPDATYIIVSNPVDVLTYTFTKLSGIPENRVIGSGTILDTSRLRARLSEYFRINQGNVHAYVFGEHGDSSFIPWSIANISNVPISECNRLIATADKLRPDIDIADIESYVRKSGAAVIARKGATYYAVSVSVCYICKCLLGGLDTTMTVSSMMHGEYGIEDVCLSTLTLVGHNGVHGKVNVKLTPEEEALLNRSANILKETISQLKI